MHMEGGRPFLVRTLVPALRRLAGMVEVLPPGTVALPPSCALRDATSYCGVAMAATPTAAPAITRACRAETDRRDLQR